MNENKDVLSENELSNLVIGFAIEIHSTLGPGLLERVYKECLYYKISQYGLKVVKEKPIPVIFEGVRMKTGYRADLVVEDKLLIELKSVDRIIDIHIAQTTTYLKLGDYRLGLIINFNKVLLKDGVKRVVYKFLD